MAPKHLTRREIKEEGVFESGLTRATEWVLWHWQKLIAAGLGLVILVAAGYFWTVYQDRRDAALQTRFAEALETFHTPVAPPAAPVDPGAPDPAATPPDVPKPRFSTVEERAREAIQQFNALADANPGTRLGDLSRYYVGLAQRDLGDQAATRASLEAVIDSSEYADIRSFARTALARMLSSNDDHSAATAQLEAALAEEAVLFPSRMTLMALAREYEAAGETSKAVETYRRVVTEFPLSEDARAAQSKLDQLEPLLPPSETATAAVPEAGS